jgi:hypothetical protein
MKNTNIVEKNCYSKKKKKKKETVVYFFHLGKMIGISPFFLNCV